MSLLFWLFIRFAFVGLFSVGGGLATLPFLYEMSEQTGWFTTGDISNMIAISESTPGPMGINMATYVGYITKGILGSVVAPLGLITPSIAVIVLVSMFLARFKESKAVQSAFYGLRPASAALIAAAGMSIVKLAFVGSNFSLDIFRSTSFYTSLLLAVFVFVGIKKIKLHPVIFIAISAVVGIVFKINIA